MLVTLTKLITKTNQTSEIEMRFYCKCCLTLLRIWPENIKHSEWVAALWDYFSKHLDTNFVAKKSMLDEFASTRYDFATN